MLPAQPYWVLESAGRVTVVLAAPGSREHVSIVSKIKIC